MKNNGFTLMEVLVALGVLAIVMALAIPSFSNYLDRKRLEAAAAALYSDLNHARMWSIKSNGKVYLTFTTGTSWCYGLSDSVTQCDCLATNGCQISSQDFMTRSSDYKNITVSTVMNGTTTTTGSIYNQFDSRRGTPQNATDIVLTNANNESITVKLRATGRVYLCSDSLTHYGSC